MATNAQQLRDYAVRLTGFAAASRERVSAALDRIGIYLVGYVKTRKLSGNPIKRRTGNLSRHIDYVTTAKGKMMQVRIGIVRGEQDVPYGKYLEHGSRPHAIQPKTKRALAFVMGGDKVYFRSVMHPGTQAYHFMRDSLTENREYITKTLAKAATGNGTKS